MKSRKSFLSDIARAKAGDKAVMDMVIKQNQGLVYHVAIRLGVKRVTDELFQAGLIGLWKAVKSFDETRHVSFSTHATWKIRGELSKTNWRPVSIAKIANRSQHIYNKDNEYIEIEDKQQKSDEDLLQDLDDIIQKTRISEKALNILKSRMQGKTLSRIAAQVGLSRERVRQIAKEAIIRLNIANKRNR